MVFYPVFFYYQKEIIMVIYTKKVQWFAV